MADKDQQAYHPATTNGYTRSGEGGMTPDARELRRQKRKKWLLYGIIFIILQTAVIALFSLTVMKVRNPKFRVRSVTFDGQSTANTSSSLKINAVLGIKNTNFGPYKYPKSTIEFYQGDTPVGSADIPKSKAQFRRTKKFTVTVDLTNLAGNSSGIVILSSRSKLSGKVELMMIFKKKKAVNMDCTMELNITSTSLQNITCK